MGDTALLLCGFFSDSINDKIVDARYYQDIGMLAYKRLDPEYPDYMGIPSFFKMLSYSFVAVTNLITIVSKNQNQESVSLFVGNVTKKAA